MGKRQFNINDYVWVKLTEKGRQLYRDEYYRLMKEYPKIEEDKEGYSRWQMWDLMQTFGSFCGLGSPLPFETDVFFDDKTLKIPGQDDLKLKTQGLINKRKINW